MSQFKEGDEVTVIGWTARDDGRAILWAGSDVAVVSEASCGSDLIRVRRNGSEFSVHALNLRLVPKDERRGLKRPPLAEGDTAQASARGLVYKSGTGLRVEISLNNPKVEFATHIERRSMDFGRIARREVKL